MAKLVPDAEQPHLECPHLPPHSFFELSFLPQQSFFSVLAVISFLQEWFSECDPQAKVDTGIKKIPKTTNSKMWIFIMIIKTIGQI